MILFSTLLLALFITLLMVPILRSCACWIKALDFPNERKVHTRPMAKVGGMAMAAGFYVPLLVWAPHTPFVLALMVSTAIILAFGILDDIVDLNCRYKFLGQFIAAFLMIYWGGVRIDTLGELAPAGWLLPGFLAVPLTVFIMVGVTNAVNLADGLDGLAGGIILLSYMCLGTVAFLVEQQVIVLIAVAMSGAILGFLRYNTHPAIVFMGDAGSQTLGFVVISLAIGLTQANTPVSPMFPLLLLGFPVFDTLVVMAERIRNGRSPFTADKNHFHHRLLRLGLYHSEAVLAIYVLQAAMVTAALFLRYHSDWYFLFLFLFFIGSIVLGILWTDRHNWKFPRFPIVDDTIKPALKRFRDQGLAVRFVFRTAWLLAPAVLVFTCLLPARVPPYFGILNIVLLLCLTAVRWINKPAVMSMFRIALYLAIPYTLFLSDSQPVPPALNWSNAAIAYHLGIVLMIAATILTLNLTRRKSGFKATPMDFILVFIALVLPFVPGIPLREYEMGWLAAKIVAFLLVFEIIIGELRNEANRFVLVSGAGFLVLGVRGILGV